MRYLTEYVVAFALMVVAIFIAVKPTTKQHWPLAAKFSLYFFSVVLFLCLALYEYFAGRPVSDMVRQAIGDSFCRTFAIESCPSSIRAEIARHEAQRAEQARLQAEMKQKEAELKRVKSNEIERAAHEQRRQIEERAEQAKLQAEANQRDAELKRLRSAEHERAVHEQRRQIEEHAKHDILRNETSRKAAAETGETQRSVVEVSLGAVRPGSLMPPKLIEAMFFNGEPLTAATTSGIKFKMTFKANGTVTREPHSAVGTIGEGTWSLSKDGFCTTWKGSAVNCYTLANVDQNKWAVVKGSATLAVWSK